MVIRLRAGTLLFDHVWCSQSSCLERGLSATIPRGCEWQPARLALLFTGDLELAKGSLVYALFCERVTPNLGAGDSSRRGRCWC